MTLTEASIMFSVGWFLCSFWEAMKTLRYGSCRRCQKREFSAWLGGLAVSWLPAGKLANLAAGIAVTFACGDLLLKIQKGKGE